MKLAKRLEELADKAERFKVTTAYEYWAKDDAIPALRKAAKKLRKLEKKK